MLSCSFKNRHEFALLLVKQLINYKTHFSIFENLFHSLIQRPRFVLAIAVTTRALSLSVIVSFLFLFFCLLY
ncbi:hypothetical protein HAX54_030837 [Datura stramonium]|uniref:Uncharacterized protein n=1 Tax=Datura stramonium TaxID=4076 RepID=A0ABS8VB52_DATST|nr:hypothetical protein [Datura stramonium]